jgi:hypothetical protein
MAEFANCNKLGIPYVKVFMMLWYSGCKDIHEDEVFMMLRYQ